MSRYEKFASEIESGRVSMGIELGSTRIKTVLVGSDLSPIAVGAHEWENSLIDGMWTYSLEDVWAGVQGSFANLQDNLLEMLGQHVGQVQSIGVSGMMHGYLPFDENGELLVPFRTWRNNLQGQASAELSELFAYPIPQRWSIAHLYQAILNGEEHVGRVADITTLAGYVHWRLTGEQVLGIGEASGVFPIDVAQGGYDSRCLEQFDQQVAGRGLNGSVAGMLPKVLSAGEKAGTLSTEGAALIDPRGRLEAGAAMCPPEGDAGTGMVATNSVSARTGNVSAGTSVFAMIVLEKPLSRPHHEIDLVTTPDGKMVAMAHSNNCTSDNNAWMNLFREVAEVLGLNVSMSDLFERILPLAFEGDAECGGLLSYGYVSGEHITGFEEGRPLFVRSSNSNFSLGNLVRSNLFSALCALRKGLNILLEEEGVGLDELRGHGGFFKTPEVGQRIMAAATNTPVSTLDSAGEGGAWGMALLAAYMVRKGEEQSLPDFLAPVFAGSVGAPVGAKPEDVAGFETYFARYMEGLAVERSAVETLS